MKTYRIRKIWTSCVPIFTQKRIVRHVPKMYETYRILKPLTKTKTETRSPTHNTELSSQSHFVAKIDPNNY